MLNPKLNDHNIILASGSPRRQQFFIDLGLDFEVRLKPVEEVYSDKLKYFEICDYLARLKSKPFDGELGPRDILITSDTIVWFKNKAIGKPKNLQDAFDMIKSFSHATHEVLTSVFFKTLTTEKLVNAMTTVTFKELSDDEIWHYVNNFEPLDKAGAYGIQDWIGLIGVTKIEGSYFNVMGLPAHLVYETLNDIVNTI